MFRFICCTLLVISFLAVASGVTYKGYTLPDDLKGATYKLNQYTKEAEAVYDGKACMTPGYMCEDCENVSLCIAISGGFIKEHVDVCPEGLTCLEATGTCLSKPNPDCDPELVDYKFICRQHGIFPDALNCRKYHTCYVDSESKVIETPATYLCASGYYFNIKTTLCDKKMINNTCPALGNPCKNTTSIGPITAKAALYYICLRDEHGIYFPQIFLCPNNELFNNLTSNCEDPTPKPATGPDGKCVSQGNFYDPLSCTNFYSCSMPGATPSKFFCADNTYYNSRTHGCTDYTCVDLE